MLRYNFLKKHVILFVGIITFFIIKLPHFALPFYWDGLWSYATAVFEMADKGPSLLPGWISTHSYRGHPLMFYFLSSLWITIFGESVTAIKSFMLLISLATLILLYIVSYKTYNNKVANISTVLFVSMNIFLSQSSQLLPEMFIAFCILLCLFFYLNKNFISLSIAASVLMLTKETGIIVYLTFLACFLVEYRKTLFTRHTLKVMGILSLSFVPITSFFILQKLKVGWFFFPNHMDLQVDSFQAYLDVLKKSYYFLAQKYVMQNLIYFTILALVLRLIFKTIGKPFSENIELRKILVPLAVVLVYILFFAYNVPIPRYLLGIIPLILMLCLYIITSLKISKYIFAGIAVLLLYFNIHNILTTRSVDDDNLFHIEQIKVTKDAIRFCEENISKDAAIACYTIAKTALSDHRMGYISDNKNEFKNFTSFEEDPDVYVLSSIGGWKPAAKLVQKEYQANLIYEARNGIFYTQIYLMDERLILH